MPPSRDSLDKQSANALLRRTQHLNLAPSWSWACLSGASVTNEFWRLESSMSFHYSTTCVIKLPAPTQFERLRRMPHGEKSLPYSISIKDQFRRCKESTSLRRSHSFYLEPFVADETNNSGRCGELHADVPILDDTIELYCLKLARLDFGHNDGTVGVDYGMVLTPNDHRAGQYRRVGLYHESFYSDRQYIMFPAHVPYSVVEIT